MSIRTTSGFSSGRSLRAASALRWAPRQRKPRAPSISLTSLIDGARGFRCLGAHRSAEAALKLLPDEKPDVVLMDIHLPRLSGIDCVRKLKALGPNLLVLMLTAYEDDDLIFQALKA